MPIFSVSRRYVEAIIKENGGYLKRWYRDDEYEEGSIAVVFTAEKKQYQRIEVALGEAFNHSLYERTDERATNAVEYLYTVVIYKQTGEVDG